MEECKDPVPEASESLLPKWMILEDHDRDRGRIGQSKERIRNISQKLNKLKQGLQVDKDRVRIVLESKFNDLEKKVNVIVSDNETNAELQRRSIDGLSQALDQERLARELLDERKTKEASLIEKQFQLEFQNFKSEFLEVIGQQSTSIEKLQKQLERERELRKESEQRFGVQLTEQVERLGDELESEKERNSKLASKVQQLEAQLEVESAKLAESASSVTGLQATFTKAMEDVCARVQVEIVRERKEREAMEENVLRLIEMTCQQVEEASTLS